MAEFSKEYLDAVNSTWNADFSYFDELLIVKDGTVIDYICEGFGSIGAMTISNEPYLLFLGADPVKLFEAVERIRNNQEVKTLNRLT